MKMPMKPPGKPPFRSGRPGQAPRPAGGRSFGSGDSSRRSFGGPPRSGSAPRFGDRQQSFGRDRDDDGPRRFDRDDDAPRFPSRSFSRPEQSDNQEERRPWGGRSGGENFRGSPPRARYGADQSFGDRSRPDDSRPPFRGSRDDRQPSTPPTARPAQAHNSAVRYQVVVMDDETEGEVLQNRLNNLGREGWRLVAIDTGRQYVFTQINPIRD